MTVSELIEELRQYPGDMMVIIVNPGYHDYSHISLSKTPVFRKGNFFRDDDGNWDLITEEEAVVLSHI